MKRSEVIEILAEMLEEFRKDLNNGSDSNDAEIILDYLENKIGMCPPIAPSGLASAQNDGEWEEENA